MTYLFRGKVIASDRWVYGNLLQRVDSIGPLTLIEVQDKETFEIEIFQVKPETVGMYSGWKDKHGNPIYQDDMLRGVMHEQDRDNNTIRIEQVIFDRGGFTVFNKSMQLGRGSGKGVLDCFLWFDKGNLMADQYWQIDNIEIVGNIHEVKPAVKDSVNHNMKDPNLKADVTNEEAIAEQAAAGQDVATTELEAQEKALDSAEEGGAEG